ncbi:MAG: holo-ACP synthase [Bacillota bacterium]
MIYGIGVDILDLNRIRVLSPNWNDPFFIKTFTENERKEAALREDPTRYFGGRFSGKEAVFKALRISSDAIRLNEIEILNDIENRPYVNLLSTVKRLAMELGIGKVSISLSNDGEQVISFAISET